MDRIRHDLYFLLGLWAILLILVDSLTAERSFLTRNTLSSPLFAARKWRPYEDRTTSDHHDELSHTSRHTDRPTLTRTDTVGPPTIPEKPKIVVLGASGLIGRLVVRQLLESKMDATIVALCRDYDKACRVLYDDMLILAHSSSKKGPKLQIVQGNLVPPEDLPGFSEDEEEEADWLSRAQSAASFYGNSVEDYDNRQDNIWETDEALEEAIRGCTTIISCVGDVRPTNVWSDLIARPLWRLLRKDVSGWCKDPRHPFYVHYSSTRKALAFAEREQLRREAALAAQEEEDQDAAAAARSLTRIRFVRISDLCVSQQPWNFIPLLTNAMHSMVFRYQEMAEKMLEASPLVDTVVLRPGDLVDDERDVNTTSLQVSPDGHVPGPSRIGREDVAALAVAATLFDSSVKQQQQQQQQTQKAVGPTTHGESDTTAMVTPPFHYTLAARWVGEHMDPYPAQGSMKDGLPDAHLCMQAALRTIRKREKRERRRRLKKEQAYPDSVVRFARSLPTVRRKVKPHGICVAIPVYLSLTMMARTLLRSALPYIPGRSWMIPIAAQIESHITMFGAAVIGRLSFLVKENLGPLLQWIPGGTQKYISF